MTADLDIPAGMFLLDGVPSVSWFTALELYLASDARFEILDVRICDSARCLNVAQFETWWPAPSSQIKCAACASKLKRVAEAMGFVLVTKELPPPIALLGDDTSRRFAMMELV